MTAEEEPTRGMPATLTMNQDVDGTFADYSLGVNVNGTGKATIGGPWGIMVSYLSRAIAKDNKIHPDFIDLIEDGMKDEPEKFGESEQISTLSKVLKRDLKHFNKDAKSLTYHLNFLNLPYKLKAGPYQWESTTKIDKNGLTSRVLEATNGEMGFFVVVGIEDKEGEDNLTDDDEEEDVREVAKKEAKKWMKNRRKSAGAAAGVSSVDDITDGISHMTFGKFSGFR